MESHAAFYSSAKVPPKANRTSISLIALAKLAGTDQRHLYRRVMPCARVDGDCRRPVVAGFRGHDIGHKPLRIVVVDRKPCTLDFDHHRVAGLEDVVYVVQRELVLANCTSFQRSCLLKTVQIPA